MIFLIISSIFVVWVLLIITLYYTQNLSHLSLVLGLGTNNEKIFQFLITYIIVIGVFYGIYKYFSQEKNQNSSKEEKYEIWIWKLTIAILSQIFITTILYSIFFAEKSNSIILFANIIGFLIFPIILTILWKAIWWTILSFSEKWKNLPIKLTLNIEIALWMAIFVVFLLILGFFGQYNSANLFILIWILEVCSFLWFQKIFYEIKNNKIQIQNHSNSIEVITAEIGFILFIFVVSASLISVYRPMPIGWDDLGVYMNFPKIMATTGSLLEWAGFYAWQLITGTGFLINQNATQAFFINQIGGILSTIAIISFISLILENKNNNKKIICLPIILGIVYYVMPMTIFQQAKDMKLDPSLMFVSITSIMAIFYGIREFLENKEKFLQNKFAILLIFIGGILAGFAFSIKLTSLILIISTVVYIAYMTVGFGGLLAFLGIFIGLFTKLNLWQNMFIWMPENINSILIFSILLIISGIIWAFKENKNLLENWKKFLQISIIFGFWVLLAVLPWFAEHIYEWNWQINTQILLNWNGLNNNEKWFFKPDFSLIYSEGEINEKQKILSNFSAITGSGQSLNEDFSRYFGQETGLNNYIKLPANLTIQKNQTWEFTDITFIFLAFVPVILLLWKTREKYKKIWVTWIGIFLILGISSFVHIIFAKSSFSIKITQLLSQINLPFWYLILLGLVLGFLAFANLCLPKNNFEEKQKIWILVLLGIYGLLFWISAFGIVWYGIVIYFLMIITIAIGIDNYNNIDDENFYKNIFITIFFVGAIGIYFFFSSLLHTTRNISTAWYNEYKYNKFPKFTTIFLYKNYFFDSIVKLNVNNSDKILEIFLSGINKNTTIKNAFIKNFGQENYDISKINDWLVGSYVGLSSSKNISDITLKKELEKILESAYEKILYPEKNYEETGKIYRIGTFFTYFINKNRSRYLDDSLVQFFPTYFYDENPNISVEKMKKIWLKFLLVDLNAATIDNDPRRNLSQRYDNLLSIMRSENLELIDTDNYCLRLAIDEIKNGKNFSAEEFINITGTNSNSYRDWKTISRIDKINNCYSLAMTILSKNEELAIDEKTGILTIWNKKFNYSSKMLIDFIQAKNEMEHNIAVEKYITNSSYFTLFEIK